jgi:hypothetical protein
MEWCSRDLGALGVDTGISKSEVSRISADLDHQLTAFRNRPLDHTRFPYVYLDATYCKARVNDQIVSRAVVVATGITEDGGREVLGLMVGDSERGGRPRHPTRDETDRARGRREALSAPPPTATPYSRPGPRIKLLASP